MCLYPRLWIWMCSSNFHISTGSGMDERMDREDRIWCDTVCVDSAVLSSFSQLPRLWPQARSCHNPTHYSLNGPISAVPGQRHTPPVFTALQGCRARSPPSVIFFPYISSTLHMIFCLLFLSILSANSQWIVHCMFLWITTVCMGVTSWAHQWMSPLAELHALLVYMHATDSCGLHQFQICHLRKSSNPRNPIKTPGWCKKSLSSKEGCFSQFHIFFHECMHRYCHKQTMFTLWALLLHSASVYF